MYQVDIQDRQYTSWSFASLNPDTPHLPQDQINPIDENMFHGDIFSYQIDGVTTLESPVQRAKHIAGVLVLEDNKTYGRNKKGKLLYKCVPDDPHLPIFLVPYEIKWIGFSKTMKNVYATFTFVEWTDKHPHGALNQVIGPVHILPHFYEYQLYCKHLNHSIQSFHKEAAQALKTNPPSLIIQTIREKVPGIEDRTDTEKWPIFTIDPPDSTDLDDAIGIQHHPHHIVQISIYISNVPLCIDALQLWPHMTKRVSTLYLPDKRRPMLPTVLSDNLCSLTENKERIAFTMDLFYNTDTHTLLKTEFKNTVIQVKKNYVYDAPELLKDPLYEELFRITQRLTPRDTIELQDSHDLVRYWMIRMNAACGQDLLEHGNGIFRSNMTPSPPPPPPKELSPFVSWGASQYVLYKKNGKIRHEAMGIDAYAQTTSPIRRLVDLLNMIQFQVNHRMIETQSEAERTFYEHWTQDEPLAVLNRDMKATRNVQNDCELLERCTNNPRILEETHAGYIVSKHIRREDTYEYSVYLPQLKMTQRMVTPDAFDLYQPETFRLFVFENEEKFKKKIRISINPPGGMRE